MDKAGLKGPLGVSIASLVVLAGMALWQIPPVLGAVVRSNLSEDKTGAQLQARLDTHDEHMQKYQDRFTGRSLFVDPKPWPPPTRPAPPIARNDDQDRGPVTPITPTSYNGPLTPMFPIGDMVYFDDRSSDTEITDPIYLFVGEEEDGVKVVSIDAPRTVRLAWSGGEFDVEFFGWDGSEGFRTTPKKKPQSPGFREAPTNATSTDPDTAADQEDAETTDSDPEEAANAHASADALIAARSHLDGSTNEHASQPPPGVTEGHKNIDDEEHDDDKDAEEQ